MWRHLFFFALLYFVQGAALAYIINFQKPYLHAQGISKETIGIFTSLLLIPFVAKVFLGALSDRLPIRGGSRKPYMILGLAVFASCYFLIAYVEPRADFRAFAALTWIASFGLALFDTCADGWAIDCAREQEQGSIQAAMIAGKSLGLLSMSLLFGNLLQSYGVPWVFKSLSALALLVLLIVLMASYERVRLPANASLLRWGDLRKSFYIAFAFFGIVYSVASFGTDGLLTLFLSDRQGLGTKAIGEFGVSRGLGALVGASFYGVSNRILGIKSAQYLAVGCLGLGCLAPILQLPYLALGVLWGLCWGLQETAYVTLSMRFAQGAWAATFFAMAMIFSNLGTSLGEALGSPLVPQLGYQGVFAGFAAVAALSILFLPKALSRIKS